MAVDKSVVMRLSLIDTATPGLKNFSATLKVIDAQIKSMNAAFSSFVAGMSNVNGSTKSASAGINTAAAAANGLVGKIGAATDAMRRFASGSTDAGAAAKKAGSDMDSAAGSTEKLESKMKSLTSTIRGAGEVWAAAKIGQGMKESAEEAIKYESSQTRLVNLNLGDKANKEIKAKVEEISKASPQINQDDIYRMAHDLVNVTGSAHEAVEKLKIFSEVAYAMKMSDPTGTLKDKDVLSIGKALELRGASQDSRRLDAELDVFSKIFATTQGRVGPQQLLGNIKYSRGGLGNTMDIGFLPQFASMIEMVQSAGGNGGQVGTMLTALQKIVLNGPTAGTRDTWKQNNLLDKKGNVLGADEFQLNPYLWAQKYLKPALERAGIDVKDAVRVNKVLNSLSGNRVAVDAMSMMITRSGQIDKDSALVENSSGYQKQNENNLNSTKGHLDQVKGSLANLAMTLGEQLLPIIKTVSDAIVSMLDGLNKFFKDNPIAAGATMIAGLFASMGFAVSGFLRLFGMFGPAATTGFGGIATQVLAFIARMGPWGLAAAAAFIAAFVFWDAIKNFDVFGKTIENRTSKLIENLVGMWAGYNRSLTKILGGAMTSILDFNAESYRLIGMNKVAGVFDSMGNGVRWVQGKLTGAVNATDKAAKDFSKETDQKAIQAAKDAAAKKVQDRKNSMMSTGVGEEAFSDEDLAARMAEAQMKEDAKKGNGWKYGGKGEKSGGGGSGGRNIAANIEAENAKFERERAEIEFKMTESLYKEHELSLQDYFDKKVKMIKDSTQEQIDAFEKEKAILAKDPKKNADKINAVEHNIQIARMKEVQSLRDAEIEKKNAIESIDRDGLSLQEKLANITNSGAKIKIALLDEEYAKKRKILEINGRLADMQALDALHNQDVGKVYYDAEKAKNGLIDSQSRTKEMQINADQKKGLITSQEAAQKIVEIKREQGRAELENLNALDQYKDKITDPAIIEALAQAKIEAKGLADTLDAGAQQFKDGFQSSIEGAINDLMNGQFSFKKLFASLGSLFSQGIAKELSETLTNSLFKEGGLLSGIMGGKGGAGGGISGFISSLFGGGGAVASGGAATASSGGGFGSILSGISSFFGSMFSFDVGADSIPRDMIAKIHQGEMILPAATAKKVRDGTSGLSQGSGQTVHQTVNFSSTGTVDRRTQDQLAKTAAGAIRRAGRNS